MLRGEDGVGQQRDGFARSEAHESAAGGFALHLGALDVAFDGGQVEFDVVQFKAIAMSCLQSAFLDGGNGPGVVAAQTQFAEQGIVVDDIKAEEFGLKEYVHAVGSQLAVDEDALLVGGSRANACEGGDVQPLTYLEILAGADGRRLAPEIGKVDFGVGQYEVGAQPSLGGHSFLLKGVEGTAKFLLKELKKMFYTSTKTKLAAAMVKGNLADMKKLLDPSEVGGTAFLGISKPVIKAHGSSDARAICNAVLRAKEYAESGFIEDIQRDIELMKVERTAEKVGSPS